MEENDKQKHYGSILNAMIESGKESAMLQPGSDYAFAVYQMLETAISEAAVWGVPLERIGLKDFDINDLLKEKRKAA